jgi:hypothetical protein
MSLKAIIWKLLGKRKWRNLPIMVVFLMSSGALAGGFENPQPFELSSDSVQRAALENSRLNLNKNLEAPYYQLGDYYERYQANTNWNNAVMSGNTIILNGDNNTVNLSMDGAELEQQSSSTCQSGSGVIVEGAAADELYSVDCGD